MMQRSVSFQGDPPPAPIPKKRRSKGHRASQKRGVRVNPAARARTQLEARASFSDADPASLVVWNAGIAECLQADLASPQGGCMPQFEGSSM